MFHVCIIPVMPPEIWVVLWCSLRLLDPVTRVILNELLHYFQAYISKGYNPSPPHPQRPLRGLGLRVCSPSHHREGQGLKSSHRGELFLDGLKEKYTSQKIGGTEEGKKMNIQDTGRRERRWQELMRFFRECNRVVDHWLLTQGINVSQIEVMFTWLIIHPSSICC